MTKKKAPGVTRLEDEMVEDVFAMSDAEIDAELREEGVDIDAFDKEMDDLFASALAAGGQRRNRGPWKREKQRGEGVTVDIGEISDLSCWERQGHYLDQYGGKRLVDREAAFPLAAFAAQAEMLDEIHTMLRFLIHESATPTASQCPPRAADGGKPNDPN